MAEKVRRRDFLKAAQAGAIAYNAAAQTPSAPTPPVISSSAYTPMDYPIEPKRYSEVKLTDSFWAPKVKINAEVTIPFEVEKLTASSSARQIGGGVLEAAILSLQTHQDVQLQAWVDARIEALSQVAPGRNNSGFEIAAAWYSATGKRNLIDKSTLVANAIYEDFRLHNRPFSGGERDAINCIQLYRVTRDRKQPGPGQALFGHPRPRKFGGPQPAQSILQAGAGAK